MWKLIGTLFCIILSIIIIICEIKRPKKSLKGRLDLFSGISLVYMFCYGIVPIFLLNLDFTMFPSYLLDSLDMEKDNFLFASILSILGYFSILMGYYYKNILYRLTKKPMSQNNHLYENFKVYTINKFLIVCFSILTFVIGTASLIQYVNSLGGITQAIKMAEVLRMYTDTNKFANPYAVMLMPLIISSCTMFYVLCNLEKSSINIIYKIMFVLTFIMSLYYYFLNAGRLPLFVFLSSFIFVSYIKRRSNSIKGSLSIVIAILVGVWILQNLDNLFSYLAFDTVKDEELSLLDKFKKTLLEFAFPYVNLVQVHDFTYTSGDFRYFTDYFTWIINIIPTSILNIIGMGKVMSSHLVNTANYGLVNVAGIPVDLVSLGYYQFALPGIIITCSLFGVITTSLEEFFRKLTHPAFILVKIRVIYLCIFSIMYADPDVIARGRLDITLIIIFLIVCSRTLHIGTRTSDKANE